jgi:hypothetical protein
MSAIWTLRLLNSSPSPRATFFGERDSPMDYRLVRYQSEFIDQIARLQTGLWSSDLATNVAYFEWKYQQNPYVSEPLIYLALENDRVVAMRGFYGSQWAIGESGQTVTLRARATPSSHRSIASTGCCAKCCNSSIPNF